MLMSKNSKIIKDQQCEQFKLRLHFEKEVESFKKFCLKTSMNIAKC